MIGDAIARLVAGSDLSGEEAKDAMQEIMNGSATPAQIASFLTALRMKGETAPEIAAFARAMRAAAVRAGIGEGRMVVDTCGTGGDCTGTFNISTASAFVAAGAGVPVVKHGNRSVSSSCGSADVLEELGVTLAVPPEKVGRILERARIAFLFAPVYHPAMQHAKSCRQEIGIRTVFNLLGPLANPAGARAQLMGVYEPGLTAPLAAVLQTLGVERAMVVHGNGLDEITTIGMTTVSELKGGAITGYTLACEDFGIQEAVPGDLAGGDARRNAAILLAVLQGEEGPCRDIVLLNAGAAICLGGGAFDLAGGVCAAARSIDSGRAYEALQSLIEETGSAV